MILIVLSSFSEPGRPLATSNYYWSRTTIHHQPHPINNNEKIFAFHLQWTNCHCHYIFVYVSVLHIFCKDLFLTPQNYPWFSSSEVFWVCISRSHQWNILLVIFQLKTSHITVTLEYNNKLLITQEFRDAYVTYNVCVIRPAQLAELPCSEFHPELFLPVC